MILDEIQNKLNELDENVFYGAVKKEMNETVWNYIVFNRSLLKLNTNQTGRTPVYSIHIVRENFIPEGFEDEVINKLLTIPGFRLAGTDGTYDYITKPGTDTVVEMFSIDFVKPRKVV